jgi:GTP cyclohydrolase II
MDRDDTSSWADEAHRRRNRVSRALSELRRGVPVLLAAADGPASLALAAETASAAAIERLLAWSGGTAVLAITAGRARALNVRPSGHDVILIPWRKWFDRDTARGIGDATTDLAAPLRGPFERALRPPTAAEAAAVRLAKHARLLPVALVAPLPGAAPADWAATHDLLNLAPEEVEAYEADGAAGLRQVTASRLPLADARETRMLAFRPDDGGVEHLAIVVGKPDPATPVLTRLHSECFTGDLLGSLKCDCGEQLRGAVRRIAEEGAGVLLYLAQEGRGIGLMNKLRAYRLQEDGFDTIDANLRLGFEADERLFQPAAEMLRQLGFSRVRLLSNNPAKVSGLEAAGIEVVERVTHNFPANAHNEFYLETKRRRGGHLF